MKNLGCLTLAVALVLLAGCSRGQRAAKPPAKTGQGGGTVEDWKTEEQTLVVKFVTSLTAEQVAAANTPDGGLACTALTKDQQTDLSRVWELAEKILFSKPGARERYESHGMPEPGPVEYAKVTQVGYALISEGGQEQTRYQFTSDRAPVTTNFDGTVAKASALTPALEAHGINLAGTGAGAP
jgi:hypothetical protein